MRFVVYGAGAIGGVVGARLAQQGHEVVLIARGAHADAMVTNGLRLEAPDEQSVLHLPVARHPAELRWGGDEVVLMCMKSQHTVEAGKALRDVAPDVPVVCLQNGVQNERALLRRFADVYAVCVWCPATHLEPGAVQASSAPVTGVLDIGRYPSGTDDLSAAIAEAWSGATFAANLEPSVMRWKYAKLLQNLGNAVEVVCGPDARGGELSRLARSEGAAVVQAAGIPLATREEVADRANQVTVHAVGGSRRGGGSSWQSVQRGTGNVETDYLNGEIVLLGRLHGIPTPVNALLLQLANDVARTGTPPGATPAEDVMARLQP